MAKNGILSTENICESTEKIYTTTEKIYRTTENRVSTEKLFFLGYIFAIFGGVLPPKIYPRNKPFFGC